MSFAGEKSFKYERSVSNQRIEAWWGQLRKGCANWWIKYFHELRQNGQYIDANIVHRECLKFCFMLVIRKELDRATRLWNTRPIRSSNNQEAPPGMSDILHFLLELLQRSNYVVNISVNYIKNAADKSECQQRADCSPDFSRLANIIMNEKGLVSAQCPQMAEYAYRSLIDKIEALL